eukprot:871543-Prorocentrum_minimum.AAC.3
MAVVACTTGCGRSERHWPEAERSATWERNNQPLTCPSLYHLGFEGHRCTNPRAVPALVHLPRVYCYLLHTARPRTSLAVEVEDVGAYDVLDPLLDGAALVHQPRVRVAVREQEHRPRPGGHPLRPQPPPPSPRAEEGCGPPFEVRPIVQVQHRRHARMPVACHGGVDSLALSRPPIPRYPDRGGRPSLHSYLGPSGVRVTRRSSSLDQHAAELFTLAGNAHNILRKENQVPPLAVHATPRPRPVDVWFVHRARSVLVEAKPPPQALQRSDPGKGV